MNEEKQLATIKILNALSANMPREAVQRTKKIDTKKGYDTTGFGYQSCVDRFNDILGENWGYDYKIIKEIEGSYKNGMPYFDIIIEMGIWIIDKTNVRKCVGGHTAVNYADALKGAITNCFKKTAAFWGVGREAYAGEIDDDNKPLPDHEENKAEKAIKETFQPKEDDIVIKLKSLPDEMQQKFRELKFSKGEVKDICIRNEWNLDKIWIELNGEKKENPFDDSTLPFKKEDIPF